MKVQFKPLKINMCTVRKEEEGLTSSSAIAERRRCRVG